MTSTIESPYLSRLAQREQEFGIVPASELTTFGDRVIQYGRFALAMRRPTPLMRFEAGNGTTIWAKVESANPFSESHYDRATLTVLRRLEEEKLLAPGMKILEGTSGSAGRSFAYFAHRLGFKLDMIVHQELPWERRRDMIALGANLIDADRPGGMGEVVNTYRRMLRDFIRQGYRREEFPLEGKGVNIFSKGDEIICAPNHSEIIITPQAFGNIAQEVIGQLPDAVRIDTFIGTLGNGSTVKGISKVLRDEFGDVRVVGTETRYAPTNAIKKLRAQFGDDLLREKFMERYGFKMPERDEQTYHDSYGSSAPGFEPPFVEVDQIDEIRLLGDEWRQLHGSYNLRSWRNFENEDTIGHTSAENLWVARQIAEERGGRGRNILVLFYDRADQYPGWPPEGGRSLPKRPTGSMYESVMWDQAKRDEKSNLLVL